MLTLRLCGAGPVRARAAEPVCEARPARGVVPDTLDRVCSTLTQTVLLTLDSSSQVVPLSSRPSWALTAVRH